MRDRDLNPCKIQGKSFLFKRLITCSECGSHISFIEKKSRYVYGFCDRCRLQKRGHIYVREELLTEAVIKEIAKLRMPDELYRITVSKLLETAEFGNGNAGQYSLGESGTDLLALKTQIARLMDLYLKGGIDSSEYSQKLAMLRSDEEKLTQLKDKKAADLNPFRQLANILLIAQQALLLFKEGTPEIKRSLLKFLFMELKLDGKRLITTMCYPFSLICEEDEKKNGRPFFFFLNFPSTTFSK